MILVWLWQVPDDNRSHVHAVQCTCPVHAHAPDVCMCMVHVWQADLRGRPDIVVATPGRLIDLLRNSPSVSLDDLEVLVLDEAE